MGDEFYAIIKLVSGEEIVSLVSVDDNNDDPLLILQRPIIMNMHFQGVNSYIKVKPWMEVSQEDIFIIKLDKIITITETIDKKIIDIYNDFIDEDYDIEPEKIIKTNGEVKLDSKMGYVTSIKDARKNLEELFKLKIEPKES